MRIIVVSVIGAIAGLAAILLLGRDRSHGTV